MNILIYRLSKRDKLYYPAWLNEMKFRWSQVHFEIKDDAMGSFLEISDPKSHITGDQRIFELSISIGIILINH